jgi:hypothetical protein
MTRLVIGEDRRYEWRVVLRNNDAIVVDETSPTTDRDLVLVSFVRMMEEYKEWPKEAVQLERREIGRWEAVE